MHKILPILALASLAVASQAALNFTVAMKPAPSSGVYSSADPSTYNLAISFDVTNNESASILLYNQGIGKVGGVGPGSIVPSSPLDVAHGVSIAPGATGTIYIGLLQRNTPVSTPGETGAFGAYFQVKTITGPTLTDSWLQFQNYTATPEPGTWAALGLGGALLLRRRRSQ